MSFTYGGNPNENSTHEVRFLIGDTDCKDPLLQDEEIKFLINQEGSALKAAVLAAEAIAAKFCRLTQESVGSISIAQNQKAEHYKKLAERLKKRLSSTDACWFAGGISVDQKQTEQLDSDRVHPKFIKSAHETPGVSLEPDAEEHDPNHHHH